MSKKSITIKDIDNGIKDSSGLPWKGPKLVPRNRKGEKIYEESVKAFIGRTLNKPEIEVIDRLDCVNRNMITLRPDIRKIVHEEMTDVINEALSRLVKELRKPQPYIERGYRA